METESFGLAGSADDTPDGIIDDHVVIGGEFAVGAAVQGSLDINGLDVPAGNPRDAAGRRLAD